MMVFSSGLPGWSFVTQCKLGRNPAWLCWSKMQPTTHGCDVGPPGDKIPGTDTDQAVSLVEQPW